MFPWQFNGIRFEVPQRRRRRRGGGSALRRCSIGCGRIYGVGGDCEIYAQAFDWGTKDVGQTDRQTDRQAFKLVSKQTMRRRLIGEDEDNG